MSEVLRELVVALSMDSNIFSRNLRTNNRQIKDGWRMQEMDAVRSCVCVFSCGNNHQE